MGRGRNRGESNAQRAAGFHSRPGLRLHAVQPLVLAWIRGVDDRPLEVNMCYLVVRAKDALDRDDWRVIDAGFGQENWPSACGATPSDKFLRAWATERARKN